MVVLIVLALLGGARDSARRGSTPAVVALLVAFPVLILLEGIVAAVELLSAIGHVLSYARIMALGTASVMLAIVANRLAEPWAVHWSASLFALLFHLVNFALGLFSPTIHALRLHYVEFFGTFYSPGGTRYQPLGHWIAPATRTVLARSTDVDSLAHAQRRARHRHPGSRDRLGPVPYRPGRRPRVSRRSRS